MNKPIFDQASLHKIGRARLTANSDLEFTPTGSEWVLHVTRDRSDIGIPKGTRLLAEPATEAGDAVLLVVYLPGEYVLRRPPVSEGKVVGRVLGVVVEVADAA